MIQIWDLFGARVYLSRPGLPLINQTVLGYADVRVRGRAWRAYGLQTANGVIQIAQPVRVREQLARGAALRVVIPLLLLLPVLGAAVVGVVGRGLHAAAAGRRRSAAARRAQPGADRRDPACRRRSRPLVARTQPAAGALQAAFQPQRAFVADAAHELRSPLTAVRLELQLLDRAPDEAARLEARADLGAAVERAIHLVEQLLTLARNEPRDAARRAVAGRRSTASPPRASPTATRWRWRAASISGLEAEPRCWCWAIRMRCARWCATWSTMRVRYTPSGGRVQVRCRDGRRARCSR